MANGMDIGSFTGSDFKGDEAIKKIMDAEGKNKVPLENQKFNLEMQKQAWVGLQKKLSDLSNASHDIYSPAYSSFRKTVTNSSDPNVLDISTDGIDPNTLQPAQYSMIAKQKAESDHFKSDVFNNSETLQASNFNILYQGKTIPINFPGGSLNSLADMIDKAGSDFLTSKIVDMNGSSYIDINGKEVGKKNAITFSGDTDFLKKTGLIRDAVPNYYNIELTNPIGLSGNQDIPDMLFNNELLLHKGDNAKKQLSKTQSIESETQLWIYLETNKLDASDKNKSPSIDELKKSDSPITGFTDKIWVGDTTLLGNSLITDFSRLKSDIEQTQTPSPQSGDSQPTINKVSVVLEYANGKKISTQAGLQGTGALEVLKATVPNGDLTNITINNTTPLDLHISKGELITLNKGKFDHKNIITNAQNAIINYKGVDQERESNTITDIVPGTITVKGNSTNPTTLGIDFDTDAILEQIKNWVIAYNNTMDFIKNVSKQTNSFLEQLKRDQAKQISVAREKYEKMSDDDKEKLASNGRLFEGVLSSDSAIRMMKSKLQSFTVKPYTTDAKEKLSFLNQLGIAVPNASQLINMSDTEKENYSAGYLDFTKEGQKQFLDQVHNNIHAVQQFFYQRKDGSKIYNDGMLIDFSNLLQAYLNRYVGKLPGFFNAKDTLLKSQIIAQQKKIDDVDDKMKRDEDKLRTDFSKVYEAQSKAKDLNNQFSRFGKG